MPTFKTSKDRQPTLFVIFERSTWQPENENAFARWRDNENKKPAKMRDEHFPGYRVYHINTHNIHYRIVAKRHANGGWHIKDWEENATS